MDNHNHRHESMGWIVVKVTLVVLVAGAIFGVGVCAGIRAAFMRKVGVFNPSMVSVPPGVPGKANMMGNWDKEGDDDWFEHASRTTRLFATITKVENNQITVLDNAAKTNMIVTLASTIITSSSTEVGLSSLKVGQNIVVVGGVNDNNLLEAKLIQIQ